MTTGPILVVEDTYDELVLIVRYLSAQGYQMLAATSGEEAVPHLDRSDLDLVITDFKLPGMNGLEVARKSLIADPDRPVILVTAFAEVDNARQAVSLGLYDFITKPFDLRDFGNTVKRALNHRHLILENQAYQRNLERMVEERTQELQETLNSLDRKVKELEGRDRINRHLLTIHTAEETLSAILEAAQHALGVERVVIFLPDVSGQILEPAIGAGVQSPGDQAGLEVLSKLCDSWMETAGVVAYRAFLEGRAIQGEDLAGTHSVVVPMLRLGEVMGVVYVENPFNNRPLAAEDVQTLANLMALSAVAVSDARLYSDSEQWQVMMERLEDDLLCDCDTSTSGNAHERPEG